MSNNLFSFTGPSAPDQTYQQGMNQYAQQGQAMINPGQAQIQQSNPLQTAGMQNLAQSLRQASSQPQLPAQAVQQGLAGGAAMGQPGPTPQALALARGLQPQNMIDPTLAFLSGGY